MFDFVVRKATHEDMNFVLTLAKEEGWNPGIDDASAFYLTDPTGFFIGTTENEKVGCISAVAYDNLYGFLGLYIVKPSFRGKGYGMKLWTHALNHLKDYSIGLDGVLNRQKDYEKSNFRPYYKNIRFTGKVQGNLSQDLINLNEVPFNILVEYDTSIFGVSRAHFLKHWIKMPNANAMAKVNNGRILGYGVIRKCYEGFKIGPLFADHIETAIEIFKNLCLTANNQPIFLDISEGNPEGKRIVETFNLQPVFQTIRMYKNHPPKQQLDKVFGITTFELG